MSAASVWEIATKVRLGKLPTAVDLIGSFGALVASQRFVAMPISFDHAELAGSLPGPLRDPFDRLLIAQSRLEKATLVSADRAMDDYGIDRLWKRI